MKRHASMNRIYRLVWSHAHKVWIPVAETTRGRSKGSSRKLFAAALSLTAAVGHTEPIGGQIVSGAGSISQSGATTTINQTSQNLSANWQSFNVAPSETVNFVQPNASAIAVNRIFDTNGTQILGHLNANGQVYLINPNGILFGQGAQVNVGGLVASTLDVSDASLNSNTRTFSGSGTGSVINKGTINAANGGSVALIGNSVGNQGVITAQLGTVALGAGNAVTLTFSGNSLVHMQVDQSVLNSLAENGGLIRADGGQVVMTAGARDTLLASVVNNTGVIEARSVNNQNGVITLLGGMAAGTVNVGGTLDASAPNGGNGGFIETSAAHVVIADDAKVTTAAPNGKYGSWLIDPQNYTVAATGGDITGAALSANLATTPITLQSSGGGTAGAGNVNVNDAVSWSANTILTLKASNNVNINANVTATGNTAGLVISPNTANGSETASGTGTFNLGNGASVTLSGATPSLSIAGLAYTVINSLGAANSTTGTDLQGMNGNLAGHYALGSNIDATGTSLWNSNGAPTPVYAGFTPVGASMGLGCTCFSGIFDGLGHTISNLTINRPTTDNIGLFGYTYTGSVIRNVGLVGGSVTGSQFTGGLVGVNTGTVSNSYTTGSVTGTNYLGGLVGYNNPASTVSNSYATGSVTGSNLLGGLVGYNSSGTVSNSYATGSVTGRVYLGGLVGYSSAGTVSNSYAIGSVTGSSYLGGLVGLNAFSGRITNSYATGSVSGTGSPVGGLVAANYGTISNSYATGGVSGTGPEVGGLIGLNDAAGTPSNSYWNTETSRQVNGIGANHGVATNVTGRTTAQMHQQASFTPAGTGAGQWDFTANTGTWVIFEGQSNPLLRSFLTPLTVTANNATKTYDGLAYNGSGGVTYSVTPNMSNLLGTLSYTGGINAGSYTITPGGLTSAPVQQGYFITYVNGALTVNKANLNVTANAASKTYDGLAYTGGNGVGYSGFVNGETNAVLGGALAYGGTAQNAIDAGSYFITPSGLTSGNYTLSFVNGILTVNPAPVTPATGSTDSGRPPEPVRKVTSLLTTNVVTPSGNNQNAMPGQPAANKDATGSGQGADEKPTSTKPGNELASNTAMKIGDNGPTVKVVDGGVNITGNNQPENKKNGS